MKDELQNKIISLIEKGEGIAPEIAAELLNQAFIIGLIKIVAASLLICLAIISNVYWKNRDKDKYWDDSAQGTLSVIGMVIGGLLGFGLMCDGIYCMFEIYLWPNSYILKSIMGG